MKFKVGDLVRKVRLGDKAFSGGYEGRVIDANDDTVSVEVTMGGYLSPNMLSQYFIGEIGESKHEHFELIKAVPPIKSYHLLYTEHCELKVASFSSNEERKAFIGDFVVKHMDNRDDFCIEMLFEGTLSAVDGGIDVHNALVQEAA